MVRVDCITFNHAPYIKDAMNGFCMQKTAFPFVCVIIDDASNDGEQEIIRAYMEENFDFEDKAVFSQKETNDYVQVFARHKINKKCYFVVYYLKYNHRSKQKSKKSYFKDWKVAKYIALCEGDDYWIDPCKLQKQVDFLEDNESYGMVCSASKIYDQGIGMKQGVFGHEYRGLEDLLLGNYIFNASVLKRQSLVDRYNQEIEPRPEWKMGDWPRVLHCAMVSKIGYIAEPMSVYRVLPNSASHFEDFDKFKAFYESSVAVSKFFIDKYNLDADKLFPILDNWLNRRLLMKACDIGDVNLVNQYKHSVRGLSAKEKYTAFLSSHYFTKACYKGYIKVRLFISRIFN